MKALFDYMWVFLIIVTTANALLWWYEGLDRMAQSPELRPGYRKLVLGLIFWGNIPWVVMGLAQLAGGVHRIDEYFQPHRANAWVVAWHGIVLGLWALYLRWLFVRKGAQALADHPGLFRYHISNPTYIKLVSCAVVGISVASILVFFSRVLWCAQSR